MSPPTWTNTLRAQWGNSVRGHARAQGCRERESTNTTVRARRRFLHSEREAWSRTPHKGKHRPRTSSFHSHDKHTFTSCHNPELGSAWQVWQAVSEHTPTHDNTWSGPPSNRCLVSGRVIDHSVPHAAQNGSDGSTAQTTIM